MEEFVLNVLYREVYGHIRDQVERFYVTTDLDAIRADPLRGLGLFDPAMLADPEVKEVIAEAVEDAIAGRRPRW